MTDPLLTIEDATREFRVSPKTVRRRLASGEIAGAYKRPGSRGPEWVMPRRSLAAAGFVPRAGTAPASVPDGAEDRAAYWERRAVDAEAALRSQGDGADHESSLRRRVLLWGGVGLLALCAVAVVVAAAGSGGDDAQLDRRSSDAPGVDLVASLVESRTGPGDSVGVVGGAAIAVLPAGRVPVPHVEDGWAGDHAPRYVVSAVDGADPPTVVVELRRTADLLARVPGRGKVWEVFDRGVAAALGDEEGRGGAVGNAGEGRPSAERRREVPPSAREAPGPGGMVAEPSIGAPPGAGPRSVGPDTRAAGESRGHASGPAPAPTAGSEGGARPSAGPPPAPAEAQVAPGDSFWTIAESEVARTSNGNPTDAATVGYWSMLVEANAERLVEPGNPDLLHVGQTLVLPPVP